MLLQEKIKPLTLFIRNNYIILTIILYVGAAFFLYKNKYDHILLILIYMPFSIFIIRKWKDIITKTKSLFMMLSTIGLIGIIYFFCKIFAEKLINIEFAIQHQYLNYSTSFYGVFLTFIILPTLFSIFYVSKNLIIIFYHLIKLEINKLKTNATYILSAQKNNQLNEAIVIEKSFIKTFIFWFKNLYLVNIEDQEQKQVTKSYINIIVTIYFLYLVLFPLSLTQSTLAKFSLLLDAYNVSDCNNKLVDSKVLFIRKNENSCYKLKLQSSNPLIIFEIIKSDNK